ncbi:uncharacterized protein LOC124420005 [Lucilia cuprina]|uniref:uncharacterized protein LOC124420005 n=1 Tax=Lucilia cuprina TaxID=7375 RepID=UPI001F06E5FF|nr:uncharacterized protein LOC124420005 [Lucilia cuprina]
MKQARTDDDENNVENDPPKKFKEIVSLTSLDTKLNSFDARLCSVQLDLKEGMKEVMKTVDQLAINVNTSKSEMKEEIQFALSSISNALATLVDQVKEINETNIKRDTRITANEMRINKLEQQIIKNNIEIKNIQNKEISEYDVVKEIGKTINIEIKEEDIANAYRIKKQNKVIVEFSTLSKKTAFMSKITKHRVNAEIINKNDQDNAANKFIYINDELTFHNRQLLWQAKTKAKEANWKFVWVRNGNIFARKNENSPLLTIKNAADIETINNTI